MPSASSSNGNRARGSVQRARPQRERERENLSHFDRFADAASKLTGRAPFFAACVLLVLLWGPSYFVFGKINTWQLIINTITTIVTFLLVALLQNTQRRGEIALHKKLNAIARALADVMESQVSN